MQERSSSSWRRNTATRWSDVACFFFQAEDGIRDYKVTGVQTCALPIYVFGRPFAPKGAEWEAALARWRQLPTDEGARYDKEITLDATALEPMITFGTNPEIGRASCRERV